MASEHLSDAAARADGPEAAPPERTSRLYRRRRAERDKLASWRNAAGLGAHFPRLLSIEDPLPKKSRGGTDVPTRDSRRFYVTDEQQSELEKVVRSLGSGRFVEIAPGHGVTTLARYAAKRAEAVVLFSRAIPVLVSLQELIPLTYEDMLDAERQQLQDLHPRCAHRDFVPLERLDAAREEADALALNYLGKISPRLLVDHIEAAIRWAVVHSLVTQPWDHVLPQPGFYRDLIGGEYDDEDYLEEVRETLARIVPAQPPVPEEARKESEEAWKKLARLAPALADPDYRGIVRLLANEARVRISLLLDLSPTPLGRRFMGKENGGEYITEPYVRVLQNTSKALKNIEEHGAKDPAPILPSLLDKTYFVPAGTEGHLSAAFQAQFSLTRRVRMENFEPLDVFTMLARHYPFRQDEDGTRTELLAAVVSSLYLRLDHRTALSTEMALLELTLRAQLQDEAVVPYQFIPNSVLVAAWEKKDGVGIEATDSKE